MSISRTIDAAEPDEGVLRIAAAAIREGGVIVYPTDTVYGIGADGLNAAAVGRIPAIKHRAENKPILVIVDSLSAARELTAEVSAAGERLMEAFWPGPLTLIFAAAPHVPAALTHGTGTIGIRIPAHPLCLRLAAFCGCPITSTSANVSGQRTPTTVEEMQCSLGPGIDLFLDAGILPASLPSTVVDVSLSPPRLVRAGALPLDHIITVIPDVSS
jgi:L-threonylcarbamoyladenylate synthase